VFDQLKTMATGFAARWRVLPAAQRLWIGCLLAGAALTVVVSGLVARHVSYGMLMTNLEPDAASQIVEKLRTEKVPFRLENGGRTIQVPEQEVSRLRLKIAPEIAASGGSGGYELLDHSKFGMTNFMQQVNYRRALEGELSETIRGMDEVVSARVHLVIPERAVFSDETKQPSASVVLHLKSGAGLGPKQVQGITALVAGAVEGLSADKVNILDAFGNLLSSSGAGHGVDAEATAEFGMEHEVARGLEERAQTLLDRVVGPDQAVVRLAVDLDFDKLDRESESYDPNNSAIRSEQQSEQSGANTAGESTSSLTNYEVNKTVEKVKKPPGSIKRLTVAVTVDGRHEPVAKGAKNTTPNFIPRPNAELDKLAALVRNAVGFDDKRGDQFQIACVQFDRSYLDEAQVEAQRESQRVVMQTVVSKGSIVLAAVVVFIALRMAFASMAKVLNATAPQAVALAGSTAPGSTFNLDLPAVTPPKNSAVSGRVSEISRKRPEEAAALILNMLEEER